MASNVNNTNEDIQSNISKLLLRVRVVKLSMPFVGIAPNQSLASSRDDSGSVQHDDTKTSEPATEEAGKFIRLRR